MHAPDFSLPDQDNTIHKLADYKGRFLIVYFYPKDNTPGCTKEACDFRNNIDEFTKRNVAIIGISKDNIKSHKKFRDKYTLPFPLLADEDKAVMTAYGAWGKKKFMGREFEGTLRNTYVINPQGDIVKTYEKVNPLTHVQQILQDIENIKN